MRQLTKRVSHRLNREKCHLILAYANENDGYWKTVSEKWNHAGWWDITESCRLYGSACKVRTADRQRTRRTPR